MLHEYLPINLLSIPNILGFSNNITALGTKNGIQRLFVGLMRCFFMVVLNGYKVLNFLLAVMDLERPI